MNDELEQRLSRAGAGVRAGRFDAAAFAERAADARVADVAYATVDSPVGELLVATTPRGLARVAYLDAVTAEGVVEDLAARISPRVLEAPGRLDGVRRQLEEYFEGRLHDFDLTVDWALVGPFGRRVLRRTALIPYGETSSYGTIARDIGSPRAARATGNALGANPVPIVVPCHRVLLGSGALGGYGGGPDRKRLLLEIESGR